MLSLAAREDVIRFEWRRLRFSGKQLAAVLKVGLPAGLQSNMYAIANIIIQACINGFGTNASAAWTAYGKVDGLFWMVMGAFGISVSTFAGQNFGAGQLERVKKSAWVGLGLASGTAALLSVLVCSFRAPLLGIFTSDAAVLQIGEGIVWMMAPYYLTYVCIEIFAAVIRGCGESLPPEVSELERFGLHSLPSQTVKPPRIAEAPVAFECVLHEKLETESRYVFIGRIVRLAARDGLIDTTAWRVNLREYAPVARFGASFYTRTNDRFSLSEAPAGQPAHTSTGIDEL